jgi:hypothetical protein
MPVRTPLLLTAAAQRPPGPCMPAPPGLCVCRMAVCSEVDVPNLRPAVWFVSGDPECLAGKAKPRRVPYSLSPWQPGACVFRVCVYYCCTYYKAVRVGGGG